MRKLVLKNVIMHAKMRSHFSKVSSDDKTELQQQPCCCKGGIQKINFKDTLKNYSSSWSHTPKSSKCSSYLIELFTESSKSFSKSNLRKLTKKS